MPRLCRDRGFELYNSSPVQAGRYELPAWPRVWLKGIFVWSRDLLFCARNQREMVSHRNRRELLLTVHESSVLAYQSRSICLLEGHSTASQHWSTNPTQCQDVDQAVVAHQHTATVFLAHTVATMSPRYETLQVGSGSFFFPGLFFLPFFF
jgi:hypothetical protein